MPRFVVIALLAWLLSPAAQAEPLEDPWESWNRKVFAFNEMLDTWVMKPVATGYQFITPEVVDQSISNGFHNIGELPSSLNALLQGKPGHSGTAVLRFLINSTMGIFGLFDVATVIGIPAQREDFAQTLAVWGVPSGNYLMLPLLGPSTLRETSGLALDVYSSPLNLEPDQWTRYGLWVLRVVDGRADMLKAESLISGDRYVFFRDAWWQQRQYLIHDGQLQDDFDNNDFDDGDWLE